MPDSNFPGRDELPSTRQLVRSTIIAIVAAIVILVTIVLPAEYAIDPTGIGRVLQLSQMGEIKQQLAAEAEADREMERQLRQHQSPAPRSDSGPQSSVLRVLSRLFISQAAASESGTIAQAATRSDETIVTLRPAEGVEYKMTLSRGAQVRYSWQVDGGVVNYDLHGTPDDGGKESSYKAARGVQGDEGLLTAGFDGAHGWFWRNRGSRDVTISLRTSGAYTEISRVK